MTHCILVTGGAGFIGSHFIRLLLGERPEWTIINLDKLTYAGNLATLWDITSARHQFIRGDIADASLVRDLLRQHPIDTIVNFAAESHVDRSIESAAPFIQTNIFGTETLLAAARHRGISRFVQVSTDEVYGSADVTERFNEDSPLKPNNPYSATKAAADMMARAYHVTYGLPVCITRCTNNYGPFQFPEKLIPVVIANAMHDKPIPVYGDGLHQREWIHVQDHCRGVLAVVEQGVPGEVYNFSDEVDITNLDLVKSILNHLKKPSTLIQHVTDRLGHDRRYRVDCQKSRKTLAWSPKIPFDQGIAETVSWYKENPQWIRDVLPT